MRILELSLVASREYFSLVSRGHTLFCESRALQVADPSYYTLNSVTLV